MYELIVRNYERDTAENLYTGKGKMGCDREANRQSRRVRGYGCQTLCDCRDSESR